MPDNLLSADKKEISKTFFHDVSTPLLSAEINTKSLKQYLPILLETYQEAVKRGEDVPEIPLRIQRGLRRSVDSLDYTVDTIRSMINVFIPQLIDEPEYLSAEKSYSDVTEIPEPECHSVQQHSNKIKILLAEDEPTNQHVIGDMLEILGCQVDLASDGQAAVRQWQNKTYDLVLMDCRLPKLDGYQATQAIRELEVTRTPIIALTAYFAEDEKQHCMQAGMDAITTKPIKLERLKILLERFITLP